MLIRLQKYDVKMIYTPGKFMFTADKKESFDTQKNTEIQAYVDMIVASLPASSDRVEQMKRETAADQTMPKQQAEQLMPPPAHTRPYYKVGVDLFDCNGKSHIVVIDYYSNYPEVATLPTTSSKAVITYLTSVFARHGVTSELYSDNGLQFSSSEFRSFTNDWGFQHNTSSPNYPRSNGLAESLVKIVKGLMKKAHDGKEDFLKNLMIYRSAPLQNGLSPAQMLMGRRIRTNLPIHEDLLTPRGTLPGLKTTEESIGSLSKPSNVIIHLRKQKYNADYDLSAKEGADTLAFVSLLEEKLLPALVFTLWVLLTNWEQWTWRWNTENITFPLNFLLPNRIHNQQLERLRLVRGDPTLEPGDQLEKELYQDVLECMTLLSHCLGLHKVFFRDSPSSLDAYVFGHLAPLLKVKLPNGKLLQHLNSQDNLRHYCTNGLVLYFPSEGGGKFPGVSVHLDDSDFDNEPHKQRNQILSFLFAMGSMLGIFMGIASIQHV
ncbi:metaxin-1-like [Salvelinus fontinalis]|uniref:metaxin-1-like n=1 Tax=Salvelinus fontinalis TaxID=8038 RepID=UPI0024869CB4|nr:metaxin-1-like [Salvelinus fontinalis]